ncbi:hypothetical protein Tco_0559445 [Tanacetum coccineum]
MSAVLLTVHALAQPKSHDRSLALAHANGREKGTLLLANVFIHLRDGVCVDGVFVGPCSPRGRSTRPAPPPLSSSTAVALQVLIRPPPSAEETKLFETDESAATPLPHPAYHVTARILIRDEPPTPFWSNTEVARLLAIPTPPPSPLSLWSSPLTQIPSPPLPPILSPLPVSFPPHASPIFPLGYRATMIRQRAEAPSTPISHHYHHPSYSTTPDQMHHHQGHHHFYPYRYLLHHHLCIYSLLTVEQTDPRLPYRIGREFTTRFRQDTDKIYTRLDDELTERQLMADRLNMLYREVISLHTQVVAQQAVIIELQAADHRRQSAITEMLAADHRRQAQFIEALKIAEEA